MKTLSKGTRVEICPYGKNYSFGYLAHLDGRKGIVKGVSGHGEKMKAMVEVDGGLGLIEYPVKALKPVKEG